MRSVEGELGGDLFRRERNLIPFDRAWTFGHADAEAMLRKHTAHGVEEVPALFGLDEAADIAKR